MITIDEVKNASYHRKIILTTISVLWWTSYLLITILTDIHNNLLFYIIWTFIYGFTYYMLLYLILRINLKQSKKILKDYRLYEFLLVLCIPFFFGNEFAEIVYSLNNATIIDVCVLSLTLILVYATMSLLSFSYASTLKGEGKSIVKEEIDTNPHLKQLTTKYKELNLKKIYTEILYKKRIHDQLIIRQSAESFLLATAVSTLGIFLIYIGFLTKIAINTPEGLITIIIKFYYSITFYLLLYGFTNFLKGLYEILKVMSQNYYDDIIVYNILNEIIKEDTSQIKKIAFLILDFFRKYDDIIFVNDPDEEDFKKILYSNELSKLKNENILTYRYIIKFFIKKSGDISKQLNMDNKDDFDLERFKSDFEDIYSELNKYISLYYDE